MSVLCLFWGVFAFFCSACDCVLCLECGFVIEWVRCLLLCFCYGGAYIMLIDFKVSFVSKCYGSEGHISRWSIIFSGHGFFVACGFFRLLR